MIHRRKMRGEGEILVLVGIGAFAAWVTHIITCIQDDRWGLLIAGGLVFPVGIIHGIGIWFGAW